MQGPLEVLDEQRYAALAIQGSRRVRLQSTSRSVAEKLDFGMWIQW